MCIRDRFLNSERIDDLFSICSPTQGAALGLLAQAKAMGVEPAPFLDALASELVTVDRARVQELAAECREGSSFVEIVETGAGFFPPPVILATRLAHDSNTLEQFCESVSHRSAYAPAVTDLTEQTPLRQFISVFSKGLMLFWIMAFVMLFIIPQFQEMFEEFGIELPAVTKIMMRVSYLFVKFWFVFFILAAIFGFLHMGRLFKSLRRTFSPSLWNQTEHSPRVQSKLNLAWLCDSGVELDDGFAQLARFGPSKRMTSKIQKAATRIAAGQAPWKALGLSLIHI